MTPFAEGGDLCRVNQVKWDPPSGLQQISAGEGIGYPLQYSWDSLVTLLVKNLPTMRETWVPSLGWEDFPGEGIGYSLQYSDLENSMDCIVCCVAKSQTRGSDFPFQVGSNSVWLVSLYRGELWRRHTHVDGTILRTTRSQERGLQWIFSSQPSIGSPQASHFTFLSLFP